MRVFVTGGGGFIGGRVVAQLLARGHSVATLARTGQPDAGSRVDAPTHVLQGDLASIGALAPALRDWGAEACVHLAWYAEPGKYLDSPINTQLLGWSLDLLRTLAGAGCRNVVMAGTCAEYDADCGYLREDTPARPATLYAACKHALYLAAGQFARLESMRFAWGRVFFPYGPGEDARRAVPALINALLRGERFKASAGLQVRDYLHVDDIASAFVALAEGRAEGAFNIASAEPITIRALMEQIGDLLGRRASIEFGALPYREWDPMFICGDNRRLRALGWRPERTLRQGLEATLAWWKDRAVRGGQSPVAGPR
jgi:nucleoside-diphosphate-sugar epimerase